MSSTPCRSCGKPIYLVQRDGRWKLYDDGDFLKRHACPQWSPQKADAAEAGPKRQVDPPLDQTAYDVLRSLHTIEALLRRLVTLAEDSNK